ncbi:MAG: delta-60 repeat domain-containing protein, partial [Verrucomicrobiae bacterium]|nr:delta-60 repeat domain-containing protein [Verrucomicrobiae bacterium]
MLVVLPPSPASATPGDLDALDANVNGGTVNAMAVQPDGKILIAGQFTSVQGVARNKIARLNVDGSLDLNFDPKPNNEVRCLAALPDGKIVVGGSFTAFQPNGDVAFTGRNRLARLNSDGTIDALFNPNPNSSINCLAVQADGKILVGGFFTSFQPNLDPSTAIRNRIARINPDGTVDTAFDPNAGDQVRCLVVQPDGKILVGGDFLSLQPNGAPSPTFIRRIARLNSDGTIDPSINYFINTVFCVGVQADGKILLGGIFTSLQPNGGP